MEKEQDEEYLDAFRSLALDSKTGLPLPLLCATLQWWLRYKHNSTYRPPAWETWEAHCLFHKVAYLYASLPCLDRSTTGRDRRDSGGGAVEGLKEFSTAHWILG